MAFLQYPWRFLLIAAFFNAIIAGGVVVAYKDMLVPVLGKFLAFAFYAVLLGILLFTQIKFFQPQRFNGNQEDHYVQYPGIQFGASSLSHEYLPKGFIVPKSPADLPKSLFVVSKGQGEIKDQLVSTQKKTVTVIGSEAITLMIHVAYFPAWHAYVDGKKAQITKTPTGVQIQLEKGTHEVNFVYESTTIEAVANIISMTSAVVFILAIIYLTRKEYGKKSS
jgi:hypothetical protein